MDNIKLFIKKKKIVSIIILGLVCILSVFHFNVKSNSKVDCAKEKTYITIPGEPEANQKETQKEVLRCKK